MPDFVSLNSIEEWAHEFELIQCLKLLREFFTTNVAIQFNVVKVAFVQPQSYREPKVVSEIEGYFESIEEAYEWLKG